MFGAPDSLPLLTFKLAVNPSADELGRLCAAGARTESVFLFSFGDATASHRVNDIWAACCELYLQVQLVEREKLHGFCLAAEELFTVTYVRDAVLCSWSRHHIFAVEKRELVGSFELLVSQVLEGVPARRREDFVQLGASMIQKQPRFAALKGVEVAC